MIDIDIGHENVTQRCYIIYPQEVNMYTVRYISDFICLVSKEIGIGTSVLLDASKQTAFLQKFDR